MACCCLRLSSPAHGMDTNTTTTTNCHNTTTDMQMCTSKEANFEHITIAPVDALSKHKAELRCLRLHCPSATVPMFVTRAFMLKPCLHKWYHAPSQAYTQLLTHRSGPTQAALPDHTCASHTTCCCTFNRPLGGRCGPWLAATTAQCLSAAVLE